MQRIYGFVQEEDGVVSRLLTEISAYFEYLARQHGDYVAFHNVKIPMEGYMAQLAPYNINRNPYCLYVKSKPEVWNTCIARQGKVVNCCASGPFCGTCYAGMGEFVFPVLSADGAVLCFLSVSGYCMDEQMSMQKMRHFARKYDLQLEKLKEVYQESVRTDAPQIEELRVRIAPLCNMFALLHRELSQLQPKALESQRQSSLLSHAIVYLQKNYAQPLRAEDVAAYCHCSVSTLSHLFKKETEKSIPEYLRNLRVQNAKQLLRGTGLSISQIADALGICNANYFCQIFKEDTGLTPSDYRRNCYEKENTKPSVL